MKWLRADLVGEVVTGQDELKNPLTDLVKTGEIDVRAEAFSARKGGEAPNEATVTERFFATPYPASALNGVVALDVGGRRYTIVGPVAESERFTLIKTKAVKQP